MSIPPPLPRRASANWKVVVLILACASLALVGGGFLIYRIVGNTEFAHANDQVFGDQCLKTVVALVELHKVRYGRYPATLQDLKFTGQWDQIWLHNIRYICNPAGNAYHVEVIRGWVGKPTLAMPEEFWRGTGYSPGLKPTPP